MGTCEKEVQSRHHQRQEGKFGLTAFLQTFSKSWRKLRQGRNSRSTQKRTLAAGRILSEPQLLPLLLSRSVASDSVRPQRRQPARLPCPCDSPGKNTGVGCYFLLQCMKVKSESEAAQSCLTPSNPMDCSPPGSSVHGVFQPRVPEWGAIAF